MGKELKPVCKTQRKFQKGRGVGSTLGKTCGRGDNGHRSRSGYKMLMSFEGGQMPLMRRLPKFGFTNDRHRKDVEAITISDINLLYNDGEEVTLETLKEKGKISRLKKWVKIILKGKLDKKVEFSSELNFSKSAKEHIEKNGGAIK